MNDLNIIKQFQLEFIKIYDQNYQEKILNKLHAETSAWFFLCVQDALNYLNHEELKLFIEETLKLPSFVEARKYYLTQCNEFWEAVELIRAADPEQYIIHAKQQAALKKNSLSSLIKKILTKI